MDVQTKEKTPLHPMATLEGLKEIVCVSNMSLHLYYFCFIITLYCHIIYLSERTAIVSGIITICLF